MTEDNKTRDAIDAVTGLAKAVPVYQDVLQPAAQEVGKGLQTVAKTIHLALAPVSALVWGYDQIKEFVSTRVAEKLAKVPPERIKSPAPNVAGPALEALRYSGHEPTLREMYANLLAMSLDSATAHKAHPAFVEMLKVISPDEAKILRLFASRTHWPVVDVHMNIKDGPGYNVIFRNFSFIGQEAAVAFDALTPNYLDNLCRLGLIELPADVHLTAPGTYDSLKQAPVWVKHRESLPEDQRALLEFDERCVRLTSLGHQFCDACVVDSRES
jgi:hypothetical protein